MSVVTRRCLALLYRVFPQRWHSYPMDKCRHPYCLALNMRDRVRRRRVLAARGADTPATKDADD